jgi:hypothetical protein
LPDPAGPAKNIALGFSAISFNIFINFIINVKIKVKR